MSGEYYHRTHKGLSWDVAMAGGPNITAGGGVSIPLDTKGKLPKVSKNPWTYQGTIGYCLGYQASGLLTRTDIVASTENRVKNNGSWLSAIVGLAEKVKDKIASLRSKLLDESIDFKGKQK